MDVEVPFLSDGVAYEPSTNLEATRRMCLRYAPMVMKIARQIDTIGFCRRWGTVEDLYQEGFLGLLNAIKSYDPDHASGAKFLTYAYRSVWNWLVVHCADQGVIKVARTHFNEQSKEEDELDEKFESACQAAYKRATKTKLFSVVGDDFHSVQAKESISEAEWEESLEEVKKALKILSDKRREVMMLRLGLGKDKEEKTLKEIGDGYNNSRERIRQLEESSISKLRNWLMETDPATYHTQVARSKMFTTNLIPHPVNGTTASVAPEPQAEEV
jgi:RNA polymerase sigma factor (sigma-70 family)